MKSFLKDCGELFQRHGSPIGKLLSQALFAPFKSLTQTSSQTISADNATSQLIQQCDHPLLQQLNQCKHQLPWRAAGFNKLPTTISERISVVEFIGPNGMHEHENIRFGLLVQGAGVHYPEHRHAAEELYFVLAGTAEWSVDNNPPAPQSPNTFVHHHSLQPHYMITRQEPLVALWGWSGDVRGATYSIK